MRRRYERSEVGSPIKKARIAARLSRIFGVPRTYSTAFTISSITFFASPNTIIVLSM